VCGLDVSYNRNIGVDEINDIYLHKNKLYGEVKDEFVESSKISIKLSERNLTPRNMSEALINESIMLRDLRQYSKMGLVNIGDDTTNDAIPRAKIIWENIG
jgi:hypothetical protein